MIEEEEATASLAEVKELRSLVDGLDGIFPLTEEHRMAVEASLSGKKNVFSVQITAGCGKTLVKHITAP